MFNEQTHSKDLLRDELTRRIRVNPRYSQRAFARHLGVSPGELSEILNGRRPLSVKNAIAIAGRLGWSGIELENLLHLVMQERSREHGLPSVASPVPGERDLSVDLFRVVSDWYCFAIVALADVAGFRGDPHWIARRLGITAHEARDALTRLERVGLLERVQGKLKVCADFVMTGAGVASEAIRNYHLQILEKARHAVETQAPDEREITGISFAVDPRELPGLRAEIKQFQDRLVVRYSRPGKGHEVYHLESALFRLTQPEPKSSAKRKSVP